MKGTDRLSKNSSSTRSAKKRTCGGCFLAPFGPSSTKTARASRQAEAFCWRTERYSRACWWRELWDGSDAIRMACTNWLSSWSMAAAKESCVARHSRRRGGGGREVLTVWLLAGPRVKAAGLRHKPFAESSRLSQSFTATCSTIDKGSKNGLGAGRLDDVYHCEGRELLRRRCTKRWER